MELIVLALFLISIPVVAQNTCTSVVGQQIEPTPFDKLSKQLSIIPIRKGEFETAAQFSFRQDKAASILPTEMWLRVSLLEEFVSYSADRQQFVMTDQAIS